MMRLAVRWSVPALLAPALVIGAAAYADTEAKPALLAGAFTEEQALLGQALYYEHCLACHGEQMTGLDQAPPLAGPQFRSVWEGEPLWSLIERIDTMPPEAPASLSRSESVDLLTYMLWYNGLPLGAAPLSAEQSILAETAFETPPLVSQ